MVKERRRRRNEEEEINPCEIFWLYVEEDRDPAVCWCSSWSGCVCSRTNWTPEVADECLKSVKAHGEVFYTFVERVQRKREFVPGTRWCCIVAPVLPWSVHWGRDCWRECESTHWELPWRLCRNFSAFSWKTRHENKKKSFLCQGETSFVVMRRLVLVPCIKKTGTQVHDVFTGLLLDVRLNYAELFVHNRHHSVNLLCRDRSDVSLIAEQSDNVIDELGPML